MKKNMVTFIDRRNIFSADYGIKLDPIYINAKVNGIIYR